MSMERTDNDAAEEHSRFPSDNWNAAVDSQDA